MSTLSIDVVRPRRGDPGVRLLVDGVESLARPHPTRLHPTDLLHSGALLPAEPPRRVAIYACGCGELGCGALGVVVERRGDVVVWHDFHDVVGAYASALPDPEDAPDPLADLDDDFPPRPLDLPTVTFAASTYLATVRRAAEDLTWEIHEDTFARHVRGLQPTWVVWPSSGRWRRHHVEIGLPHTHGQTWLTVRVPSGDPAALARQLVEVVDVSRAPGALSGTAWWS